MALPGQLGGESVRKLAGTTKRFWEAGWDALSVAAAVIDLYETHGRRFPTYRPGNPAAWLGWALRQVDTGSRQPSSSRLWKLCATSSS